MLSFPLGSVASQLAREVSKITTSLFGELRQDLRPVIRGREGSALSPPSADRLAPHAEMVRYCPE
jgi:hypothetical protein